jgi:putative oxidoreductase
MKSSTGVDVARLLLRAALGGTMIAHGVRHGRTLAGTAGWFGSIGFRRARLQAVTSAAVEVGAGTALLAGAATPLAASAVVGTMAVAGHAVHRPNGFFVVEEGVEYVGNLATASVALAALGPGRFSVDRALGLDEWGSGPRRAALAAGVGLAAAAAQLGAFWRPPAPGEPEPASTAAEEATDPD